MSVIVNILASIGLIVIIGYLIYYLYIYIKYRNAIKNTSQINPPGSYMQNAGIMCPDYWVNTGTDSKGNYTCKNSFNLNTTPSTSASCANFSCATNNETTFTSIPSGQTWDYNNPNGLTSMSDQDKFTFVTTSAPSNNTANNRCKWLNCCGPNNNTQAIWSGINEVCNTPPASS